MLDLLVRHGQIIDGTGAVRRGGDVGVRDGRIVALGHVDEPAVETLDVDGAIVAPGFVDIHTHYDAQVMWDPALTSSTLHGVTTVVGGNCGFSIAPLTAEGAPYLMSMLARVEGMPLSSLEHGLDWDWASTADYLARLQGRVGPNVGFMVGHSAIRRVVMGPAATERRADTAEVAAMAELLRQGLAAGGLGFSSSLAQSHNDAAGDPVPSRWADHDELLELATVCGEFPGTCLEMVPHAGPGPFPDPVQQLLVDLTVRAGRPLNWNIINANATNREEVAGKLAVSNRATEAGGRVVGLFMPMPITLRLNFMSGFVLDMLPGWDKLMALPVAEKLAMMGSAAGRSTMRELAEQRPSHWIRWGDYVIDECFNPETASYQGRRVNDIAAAEHKDPYDTLLDIAVADGLRTTFGPIPSGDTPSDWEARGELLRDGRVVVGASDAGAHLDMIDTFRYATDLFARGVRAHGLLTTEEAVRLLTGAPASLHGLRDRGVLREGAWADLVVFDEATIASGEIETRADLPGGERRLFAAGEGISRVIVNGRTLVEDGQPTEARPGRVLLSGRDTVTPSLSA